MTSSSHPLQFQPFNSAVDVSFWYDLGRLKLEEWKLDAQSHPITGVFNTSGHTQVPSQLCIGAYSFTQPQQSPASASLPSSLPGRAYGELHNANTIESFQSFSASAMMDQQRDQIWRQWKERLTQLRNSPSPLSSSSSSASTPSSSPSLDHLLSRFLLLTFADLKSHKYLYWFGFPAIVCEGMTMTQESDNSLLAQQEFGGVDKMEKIVQQWRDYHQSASSSNYFMLHHDATADKFILSDLEQGLFQLTPANASSVYLGFIDPCPLETNMGWTVRNLLTFAFLSGKFPTSQPIKIFAFRDGVHHHGGELMSRVFTVRIDSTHSVDHLLTLTPKCVGWERNLKTNKLGPKIFDLGSQMDPLKLSEQSVDLNLKLMRWRALPELDLERLTRTRCLLLGSGTLGCNVGRALLGWGFRHITFVDSGKVSYSNPVRQSLYEFTHARDGEWKATCAADGLKRIYPNVHAEGVVLNIPMAGHAVAPAEEQDVRANIRKLASLIDEHDVIFLLTDSRESRWVPTVMAAANNKFVINTALGFDTYLVMRHGDNYNGAKAKAYQQAGVPMPAQPTSSASSSSSSAAPLTSTSVTNPHADLGCYFCNDVVAPTDSLTDRTLDQQCTVTRPGLAFISSALAVELCVSVLHHPLGRHAPGDIDTSVSGSSDPSVGFGLVPHQLRGFLTRFATVPVRGEAFNKCTACSQPILDAYSKDGEEFILKAMNEPTSFIEDLAGLTQLKADTERMMASIDMDAEDDENEDF